MRLVVVDTISIRLSQLWSCDWSLIRRASSARQRAGGGSRFSSSFFEQRRGRQTEKQKLFSLMHALLLRSTPGHACFSLYMAHWAQRPMYNGNRHLLQMAIRPSDPCTMEVVVYSKQDTTVRGSKKNAEQKTKIPCSTEWSRPPQFWYNNKYFTNYMKPTMYNPHLLSLEWLRPPQCTQFSFCIKKI